MLIDSTSDWMDCNSDTGIDWCYLHFVLVVCGLHFAGRDAFEAVSSDRRVTPAAAVSQYRLH